MSNFYKNNILKCTSLIQFEETPSLIFKYKTHDLYLEDNYKCNKNKWFNGSSISVTENKSDYHITETEKNSKKEIVIDINQITEIEQTIEKNRENFNNSINKKEYKKEDIKIISVKKKKNKNNVRQLNNTCPYCLSKLVLNEFKILECSGDKLNLWIEQFEKYDKLNEPAKIKYLKDNYNDSGLFVELYERWNYKDEKGIKQQFTCVYSNRLGNPISSLRTCIFDPCLVKCIERSLGRKLTEQELNGEIEIWKENNSYFSDYKKGRQKVKIPRVIFPDGLI